jgi:serine/threonine protein kinase
MPLKQCLTAGVNGWEIVHAVHEAFEQIYSQRVLHLDPEPRNMLYDPRGRRAIVADFDRAVHDVFEGQQYVYGMVLREGEFEYRPTQVSIDDNWFNAARGCVAEGD